MERVAIAAGLLFSLSAGRLLAQEPSHEGDAWESARSAIARGEAMFAVANFGAALAEFNAAYDSLSGYPRRYAVLNNIAACYERLFQYDLAIAFYERYLQEGGDAVDDRLAVQVRLQTLDNLLATLIVASSVPAEVWIDDRKVGQAPGTIRVAPGTHTVELRAALHEAVRKETKLATGATVRLEFELETLSQYSGLDSAYFWTFTGLTAVAAGVGAGFGIAALAGDAAGESRARTDRFLVTQEDANHVQRLARTADIAFVGAAVLGASTVVLFFLTQWGEQPPSRELSFEPYAAPHAGTWQFGVRGVM